MALSKYDYIVSYVACQPIFKENGMNFPNRLRAIRKETKISQKAIAEQLNIALRQYQRYEYGDSSPTLDVLIALADYFNVSLDYLVGRSDDHERR